MNAFNKKIILLLLVVLAAFLLAVGLTTPIFTFKKFIFIQNTFSILSATWNLLKEGQMFLFLIISIFSIILPIFKIGLLTNLILNGPLVTANSQKIVNLVHRFGRWSMLDVFVVAILVVAVKLGAIADVEKHMGLYAYAAAALLIMLITSVVIKNIESNIN